MDRKTSGPPVVKEGRTCLPARAIGEALYYSVQWVDPEDDKPGMVIFWAFPWEEFHQKSGRAGIARSQLYSGIQHAREYAEKLVTLADRKIDFSDEPKYRNNMYNARLAAEKIDGTVLQPGETFSFNAATGPRTRENGFVLGLGLTGPDPGSGVCRTATILYQAAREAGLEIVERRTHIGGDVPYASHEDDAAVQWNVTDLKFRNHFDFPVKIQIWPESKNSLRAKIIRVVG